MLIVYIIELCIVITGIAVGFAMIYTNTTSYEVIISTTTLAVSIGLYVKAVLLEKLVNGVMIKKTFKIDIGLRKGYDAEAIIFTVENAISNYENWMKYRVDNKLPVVTGYIIPYMLVYPVRNNNEDGSRVVQEPGCSINGEMSPKYDKHRHDDEILDTLKSLSLYMGQQLQQKRIYLSYRNNQYTIDI